MPITVAPESYLAFMARSLGPLYGTVLPLLGLVLFAAACLIAFLGRRPATIAASLPLLLLPLALGALGMVDGTIGTCRAIATTVEPRPVDLAHSIARALFTPLTALLATMPAYLVMAGGLLATTLISSRRNG